MLEIYAQCLHCIWKWTKQVMLGLAVLLPGIIFLAYMFVSGTQEVGWVPSILVIAATGAFFMSIGVAGVRAREGATLCRDADLSPPVRQTAKNWLQTAGSFVIARTCRHPSAG